MTDIRKSMWKVYALLYWELRFAKEELEDDSVGDKEKFVNELS